MFVSLEVAFLKRVLPILFVAYDSFYLDFNSLVLRLGLFVAYDAVYLDFDAIFFHAF